MDRQQHGYTSSVTQREYSARLTTTFIFRNSSFSFMQMIPILFILNKHFIPVSRKMTRHVESLSPLHSVISLNTRWQTWARKLSPFQCVLPTFSCWERMRGCGSHHIYNQFILRRRKQNKSFPIIITINVKVFFFLWENHRLFTHVIAWFSGEKKPSHLCSVQIDTWSTVELRSVLQWNSVIDLEFFQLWAHWAVRRRAVPFMPNPESSPFHGAHQ